MLHDFLDQEFKFQADPIHIMGMLMFFECSTTDLIHNLNYVAYIMGSCNLLNASFLIGFFGCLMLKVDTSNEKELDSSEYLVYYTNYVDRKNKILLQELWFQDAFVGTKIKTSSFNTVSKIVMSNRLFMEEQNIDFIKPLLFILGSLVWRFFPPQLNSQDRLINIDVSIGLNVQVTMSAGSRQVQEEIFSAVSCIKVKKDEDRTPLLLNKAVKTVIPSSYSIYKRIKTDNKICNLQVSYESIILSYSYLISYVRILKYNKQNFKFRAIFSPSNTPSATSASAANVIAALTHYSLFY